MHLFEIPSKALWSLLELMIPNRAGIERPACHGEVPVWSPDWPIFSSPTGTAPILLAKEPIKCPNAFLSSIPLDKARDGRSPWVGGRQRKGTEVQGENQIVVYVPMVTGFQGNLQKGNPYGT